MPSSVPPAGPRFSFEFFPPKSDQAALDLDETAQVLSALKPSHLTITYGAGGSTRTGTYATATRLARITRLPVAAHLTFFGSTRDDLAEYTDELWNGGIRSIVALRGDVPPGKSLADYTSAEFYHYTSDFVAALKARHDFDITVGAYPEKHPDAMSLAHDIEALRKKCDAGASQAITQFFFDPAVYYRFLDETAKAGITTPIYPGLLPVGDFERVRKFATTCHASIPLHIQEKFAGLQNDPDGTRRYATDLLVSQVEDLKRHGVGHIHFYTLNRADLCATACKATGLAL